MNVEPSGEEASVHSFARLRWRVATLAILGTAGCITPLVAQEADRLFFPDRALLPDLLAGPRDPVTKAELLLVTDNPNRFGDGVEAEVAVGVSLPVLQLRGSPGGGRLVAGLEVAAFARFGLQVVERELVATDWVFAAPVVWRRKDHWLRLAYYHTSSHLGDEYSRRFEEEGVNFARDAVETVWYLRLLPALGAYGGARYAVNVHPEDSKRWVLRGGAEVRGPGFEGSWQPYVALDVQTEQDNTWEPRWHLQAGTWFARIRGRRALRAALGLLAGPSPLGQFQGLHTTQLSLSVQGNL